MMIFLCWRSLFPKIAMKNTLSKDNHSNVIRNKSATKDMKNITLPSDDSHSFKVFINHNKAFKKMIINKLKLNSYYNAISTHQVVRLQ